MLKFHKLYLYSLIITILQFAFTIPVSAEIKAPITSPNCNQFTFDATGSADVNNDKITYAWDFGDGETAEGMIVQHTYKNSGDYFVNLMISDKSGLECVEDSYSQHVSVNIPPYVEFTSANRVCVNESFNFDANASRDDAGSPLSYSWNFGDGATEATKEPIISHAYAAPGTYTIELAVDNNLNTVCNKGSGTRFVYVNAPPKADAGREQVFQCVTREEDLAVLFDASNTVDLNSDELIYTWDMGDSRVQQGVKVTHTFPGTGVYDVKLLVDDQSNLQCSTAVDFTTVHLSKAPKADAGKDIDGCTGVEINFDGSKSYSETKGTLKAVWNFGDGKSAEGLVVKHTYESAGQFKPILTIVDQINELCPPSTSTVTAVINASPKVSIISEPLGCVGNEIQFNASGANDPDGDTLQYYWTFGDGENEKGGAIVKHKYQRGGDYRVSLVVDDGKNSDCSTATVETRVSINTPPVADSGPNLSCCVGKETEFNASASSDPDNNPLLFTWDMGDGTTLQGATVKYTYANKGSYNVVLTVDDKTQTQCSKSSSRFIAEVNEKPVATFTVR
ncbi:MAG: PKD domain-containing protein [Candidatus Omnitrophica bacterium]|nr:PKD domain-containing protein [Candidatus Omnitrophota bacterium]